MPGTNIQAIRITLFGRVQGVGFRDYALKKALNLNIGGYVKNQNDGSVLVVAEGAQPALDEYQTVLSKGPLMARVESIEADRLQPTGTYREFKIHY